MVAAILEFYKNKTPLRTIQKLLTSSVISTCKIIIKCIFLNSSIFWSMFYGFLIVEEKTKKKKITCSWTIRYRTWDSPGSFFFITDSPQAWITYLMIHAMIWFKQFVVSEIKIAHLLHVIFRIVLLKLNERSL
jgi:hypothetical protein